MGKILTLTLNPAVDRSVKVSHITPDDKLRCFDERLDPGGGGINVCRVIQSLGGTCEALYTCGGPVGEHLKLLLDAANVRHHGIPIEELTRENFVVQEQVSQKEFRFNMPGPKIQPVEWQAIIDEIEKQSADLDYLVVSGSLPEGVPPNFYRLVVERIRKRSTRIVLDTSGTALKEALGPHVFLIKPNLRELRTLVDAPLENDAEQEEAAFSLVKEGKCEVVVLSMGASGALLVSEDIRQRFQSPVVAMKSTVGAGDSMVAGIVFRLAKRDPLIDAVAYGVACGAAAVATPGTGLGSKTLVESLLTQRK